MSVNPLVKLADFGQSIWLDYIRRDLISSGELKRLIDEDGLRGLTSNPSIFEKAIGESHEYDEDIKSYVREGKNTLAIIEVITQQDVQHAADQFRALYDHTLARDGYVSLEVAPTLARNSDATLAEARQLWAALNRPNVFVKVPGTAEGLPVIRQLISDGINVNVTLLFGIPRYKEVVEAYISGLEERASHGKPVKAVASVASFFISRIDALVDPLLDKTIAEGGEHAEIARKLHGKVAISSAKVAYQYYKEAFTGAQFSQLADKGAATQRLLWASTSTKNKDYSDVIYVDELVGAETVNTVPVETLDAYRDHGNPSPRIETDIDGARWVLDQLPELGIDIDKITQQLEDEGVDKFAEAAKKLMSTLDQTVKEKAPEA